MWENCFYVGGADDGVIETGAGFTVGAAVCWGFMRTQTVRRLRGRVDIVVGGSGWWSIPENWRPRSFIDRFEEHNSVLSRLAIEAVAGFVGAPVVHGAHSGTLECGALPLPFRYRGQFEGGAAVVDSDGKVLARRECSEGEGVVIAEVAPRRRSPTAEPPESFWLHRRNALQTFAWNAERIHGRRRYRRHNPTVKAAADPRIRRVDAMRQFIAIRPAVGAAAWIAPQRAWRPEEPEVLARRDPKLTESQLIFPDEELTANCSQSRGLEADEEQEINSAFFDRVLGG